MKAFTLDTNCLIALENDERSAPALRALVEAHAQESADVAFVAISASERQRSREHLRSYLDFRQLLADLGLAHLNVLRPMCYWGVTFWDHCIWSDENMLALERTIHEALFPSVEFSWADYCKANGIDTTTPNTKWRNCKCDVQAVWTHIRGERDVFVTTDRNFHKSTKKPALIKLGAKAIERPEAAASLL